MAALRCRIIVWRFVSDQEHRIMRPAIDPNDCILHISPGLGAGGLLGLPLWQRFRDSATISCDAVLFRRQSGIIAVRGCLPIIVYRAHGDDLLESRWMARPEALWILVHIGFIASGGNDYCSLRDEALDYTM